MNVRFYLKRPKSDTPTVICSQINYNMTSFKYYLPIKINLIDWDFKSQRMKQMRDKTNDAFNDRLEWVASKIVGTFYNYLNNNDGQMPTEDNFRKLLDKVFEKKQEHQAPSNEYIEDLDFDDSNAILIVNRGLIPQILAMIQKNNFQCVIVKQK